MKKLPLHVSQGNCIYGDDAYTDYTIEDEMQSAEHVRLCIARKSNSKRPHQPWGRFLKSHNRKRIETIFSEIKNLFLRKIHAVTFKGFLIKIIMFVITYDFNQIA